MQPTANSSRFIPFDKLYCVSCLCLIEYAALRGADAFRDRSYRRFPVCCPGAYHTGLSEGSGTVRNISLSGWRLSGDVPMRVGQTCSLSVTLSDPKRVFVVAGTVRWVRGQECGIETL